MRSDGVDQTLLIWMTLVIVTAGFLLYLAAEIPALLWSAPQGRIAVLPFADAVGGMTRWIVGGLGEDPRTVQGLVEHREMLPPLLVWIALDAILMLAVVAGLFVAWLRIDRWRSLEPLGLPAWDPRSWVVQRSWARPRDLRRPPRQGGQVTRRVTVGQGRT